MSYMPMKSGLYAVIAYVTSLFIIPSAATAASDDFGTLTLTANYQGHKANGCTIDFIESISDEFTVPASGLGPKDLFGKPHETVIKFKCTGTAAKTAIASIVLSSNAQDAGYRHDHFPFANGAKISSIRVKSYGAFARNDQNIPQNILLTGQADGVITGTKNIDVVNGEYQYIYLRIKPYTEETMIANDLIKTFNVDFSITVTYS